MAARQLIPEPTEANTELDSGSELRAGPSYTTNLTANSFCCDSNGGCCDTRRCLLLHSQPAPEPELWPVLRLCQQNGGNAGQ
eukprot:scaffold9331_cov116-Isochrysis_galbana.AAC.5